MWNVTNQSLMMTEGDFGVQLPVTISGVEFSAADSVKFIIKSVVNGSVIIEKTFTDITDNTFNLDITEAESALLKVGSYVYALDWYQSGAFMCNIVQIGSFKVVEKA